MRLLLVGGLSWHPERVRSLCERGHELWGLWSRSMAWDQGPYPATEGCVERIALRDAASTIREESIDCVYSLFQVYDERLWAPPSAGVEHGVWTVLRTLLEERARGGFDAPIVRHWGFDVHDIDLDVARAMDGHVLCNREKLEYWTAPVRRGGRGLDVFEDADRVTFLDSDRPKQEFMNDRFAPPVSDHDGEIHTVCVGRPFNIDYLAAARHGIHVHVYSNSVDDVYREVALGLPRRATRRGLELLGRYLHIHRPLQPLSSSWSDVRRTKSGWVEEFSRYDAAWSYIGNPMGWTELDDRAAIPNRVGTYLLAGLPVITDIRPGFYRYEELRCRGVEIAFDGSDYGALRRELETERDVYRRRTRARECRHDYSFDATIEPLIAVMTEARERYLATPLGERSRFRPSGPPKPVSLYTHRDPVAIAGAIARRGLRSGALRQKQVGPLVRVGSGQGRRVMAPGRARRLRKILGPLVERGGSGQRAQ